MPEISCPNCQETFEDSRLVFAHFLYKHPLLYIKLKRQGADVLIANIPGAAESFLVQKLKIEQSESELLKNQQATAAVNSIEESRSSRKENAIINPEEISPASNASNDDTNLLSLDDKEKSSESSFGSQTTQPFDVSSLNNSPIKKEHATTTNAVVVVDEIFASSPVIKEETTTIVAEENQIEPVVIIVEPPPATVAERKDTVHFDAITSASQEDDDTDAERSISVCTTRSQCDDDQDDDVFGPGNDSEKVKGKSKAKASDDDEDKKPKTRRSSSFIRLSPSSPRHRRKTGRYFSRRSPSVVSQRRKSDISNSTRRGRSRSRSISRQLKSLRQPGHKEDVLKRKRRSRSRSVSSDRKKGDRKSLKKRKRSYSSSESSPLRHKKLSRDVSRKRSRSSSVSSRRRVLRRSSGRRNNKSRSSSASSGDKTHRSSRRNKLLHSGVPMLRHKNLGRKYVSPLSSRSRKRNRSSLSSEEENERPRIIKPHFACLICKKPYTCAQDVVRHELRRHKDLERYFCPFCKETPRKYASMVDLKKHVQYNHRGIEKCDQNFICWMCQIRPKRNLNIFLSHLEYDYSISRAKHYTDLAVQSSILRCNECNSIFSNLMGWLKHRQNCTSAVPIYDDETLFSRSVFGCKHAHKYCRYFPACSNQLLNQPYCGYAHALCRDDEKCMFPEQCVWFHTNQSGAELCTKCFH